MPEEVLTFTSNSNFFFLASKRCQSSETCAVDDFPVVKVELTVINA